mgnify:CR=1 FL=1
MTTITAALLRRIMPGAGDRAELYAPHLEAARSRWVGDKPEHVAMWLAQLAHESGELRYVREIASGNAYEGRADLGNTQPGDGPRFRGRGLIQLTGRDNYARAAAALGLPLLDHPELLEAPAHAAAVSGWFWHWARCGERMDAADDPVLAVPRRINGGTNGLERRRAYYAEALAAIAELHAAPIEESQPTIVRAPEPAPAPAPEPAPQADPSNTPPSPAPVGTTAPQPPGPVGIRSEKEADPASKTKPVEVILGRPAAAQGLEIITKRPRRNPFSLVTRATAIPESPVLEVKFNRSGAVSKATIVKSSGTPDVDSPVLAAVYGWTARGKELELLPSNDPEAGITIRVTILLR